MTAAKKKYIGQQQELKKRYLLQNQRNILQPSMLRPERNGENNAEQGWSGQTFTV